MTFVITAPVGNDPVDPATASFVEIMRLLDRLPPDISLPRIHSWAGIETCQEDRAARFGPGFADELRFPMGR
jgi:hypothetical protein